MSDVRPIPRPARDDVARGGGFAELEELRGRMDRTFEEMMGEAREIRADAGRSGAEVVGVQTHGLIGRMRRVANAEVADESRRQQVVQLVVAELELAALLGRQAHVEGLSVLELDVPTAILLVEADPFVLADLRLDGTRRYQETGADQPASRCVVRWARLLGLNDPDLGQVQ